MKLKVSGYSGRRLYKSPTTVNNAQTTVHQLHPLTWLSTFHRGLEPGAVYWKMSVMRKQSFVHRKRLFTNLLFLNCRF